MPKKLTIQEFLDRSNHIHKNKYDYSDVIYTNGVSKVSIGCSIHGKFEQGAWGHLKGAGCPKCAGVKHKTTEEFIKESSILHKNKYDYSKVKYISARKKVEIICLTHGSFFQEPLGHISGSGCPQCAHSFQLDTKKFIEKAQDVHFGLFDYSKTVYVQSKTKLIITCKKHGDFKQTPNQHLKGNGCPYCRRSKGEITIFNFLKDNNIKFVEQYRIDGCKNKRKLPFDFFLPDFNTCIEFDGLQHFKASEFFGGSKRFAEVIKNDTIKNDFCENNKIELIRINDFNMYSLNELLKRYIQNS